VVAEAAPSPDAAGRARVRHPDQPRRAQPGGPDVGQQWPVDNLLIPVALQGEVGDMSYLDIREYTPRWTNP
jgi:hypothetical protein